MSLIAVAPIVLFADGTIVQSLIALVAAATLLIIGAEVRPREAAHLLKIIRPVLVLLAIPALWILLQLSPMPFSALVHPMWVSTAEALKIPLSGHISIDLGATLMGLARYLMAAGILVIATTIAIDRTRVEWVLAALTLATTALAAVLILFSLSSVGADPALHAASALGVVTAATATIRSIERFETRRTNVDISMFFGFLTANLLALLICWLALIFAAPKQVTFAAGCGLATVVLVVVIRRLGLGPAAGGALATVAIIAAGAIAIGNSYAGNGDLTLRFAADAPPSAISIAQRMMADNYVGTGVGSFKALLHIYREIDDVAVPTAAPTTAAQITIEMGRFAIWTAVLMALSAIGLLLRGALSRGRDSFYATGAAGSVVCLTTEAFTDTSLLGTAIVVFGASALGIGFAQCWGRTTK
jgi:hypothetical protein